MEPVFKSTYLYGLPVISICLVTLAGAAPTLARDISAVPAYYCAYACHVPANASPTAGSIAVRSSGIFLACRALRTVAEEHPIRGVETW